MTYQAPDGWRLPPRCPQHAAPFGSSVPLGAQPRRALRLFVAAGAWAAGLCLIIGSVALVAEVAGPPFPPTHVTVQASQYRLGGGQLRGHGVRPDPAPGGPRDVLHAFAGAGSRTTSQFTVAPHSPWELRWSYKCAARSPRGRLIIREGNAASSGVAVNAAGAAGQGSAWTYSDAGTHYLMVLTNCDWTVEVAGDR